MIKFINGLCLGFLIGLGTMCWLTVPPPPDIHLCTPAPRVFRDRDRAVAVCRPWAKIPEYNKSSVYAPQATVEDDCYVRQRPKYQLDPDYAEN